MQLERIELDHLTVVTGYGNGGFKIAGERFEGSLLLSGEVLHHWPVGDVEAITLESLEAVIDAPEKPDLLLFGTGTSMKPLPGEVAKALKARGFAVETMDTGAACRTYSFLAMEGRRVAGALIAV